MAKRFTASDKWEDLWFSDLTSKYKLFWIYMLDKCDNAGIWEKNFKVASFLIGDIFTEPETLEVFKQRIIPINGNKWFIPKFIQFQYGELNSSVNPHKPVIAKLEALGLLENGVFKGINTLEQSTARVKDIDKDKAQDKDKGTVFFKNSVFLDTQKFEKAFYSIADYHKYDWKHYYEAVRDWSLSKNKKMADWIATARAWARKDGDKYLKKNSHNINWPTND
jgi:hypothetical protein